MTEKQFKITKGMRSKNPKLAALAYARAGWPVLAVWGVEDGKCACGRSNCKSPGKHPISDHFPNGHKSATRNRLKIRKVWREYPSANIGIVPDGFTVIDVDGPEGRKSLKTIDLLDTARADTGRGYHLYFQGTLKGKAPRFDGIDIKGSNGYVVAPPSKHVSGAQYKWLDQVETFANLPEITNSDDVVRVDFSKRSEILKSGERNNGLTSLGGLLRSRGYEKLVIRAALLSMNKTTCTPPLPDNEVRAIARSVCRYDPTSEDYFGNMEDVVAEKIEWLIYPYLPLGATTILDGDPALGKSCFTLALAAAVSHGAPPPFAKECLKGRVLILSAEDDPARVLKPRLEANGANMKMIRYLKKPITLDEKGIELVRLDLSAHRPLLLIIDPLVAYMGSDINLHHANDMTRFMWDLDELAIEFNCAILAVRHVTKSGGGKAIYRGLGSIGIMARARSGLAMAKHPDDPDLKAVAHSMHNYSKPGPTILFDLFLEDNALQPKVRWHGVSNELSADDLLDTEQKKRGRPDDQIRHAMDFLRAELASGGLKKREIEAAAERRNFSRMTLRRAADEIGIVKSKDGRHSFWTLP